MSKSVITLTALWELLLDRFDIARVLVIAPKRVAEDPYPRGAAGLRIPRWRKNDPTPASVLRYFVG